MKRVVYLTADFEPGKYTSALYSWDTDLGTQVIEDMTEEVWRQSVLRPLDRRQAAASGIHVTYNRHLT